MAKDASIDEFVGRDGADATDDESRDVAEGDDVEEGGDVAADIDDPAGDATELTVEERVASASPAASTSRYEPDGTACAACGDVVERLWVADGDDVCEACKPW
jgi:hypothetical protein